MARGRGVHVHRRVGRDLVGGRRVREDDVARARDRPHRGHGLIRYRVRIGHTLEIREAGDCDRDREGTTCEDGPAAGLGPARAQEGADGERDETAHDRHPHHPAGPSLLHAVRELPVDEELRGQPGAEGERDAGQARAAGEDERPREREGEREEGRETACLRDGEHVREEREELRDEQEREAEERAAEHELRPAAAGREARERDRQEPGDDDRAAAGDRLGCEADGVAEEVERVSVVLDLERATRRRRPRGRVVRDDGEEPGEVEDERDGHGRER